MWLLANAVQHVSSHYNAGHAWGDHGHGSRGADASITGSPHAHHGPPYAHQHHPIAPSHRLGLGAKSSEVRVESQAKTVIIFRHVEKTGGTYIALTLNDFGWAHAARHTRPHGPPAAAAPEHPQHALRWARVRARGEGSGAPSPQQAAWRMPLLPAHPRWPRGAWLWFRSGLGFG